MRELDISSRKIFEQYMDLFGFSGPVIEVLNLSEYKMDKVDPLDLSAVVANCLE